MPASPAVRTSSAGRRSPPPGACATPSRLRTCIAPKAASRASEEQRTPRTAGSATAAAAAGAGCLPSKEAPAAACPRPTPPGPGLRARLTSPPPRSPASLAAAPRAAAISSLGVNRPATLSPSAIMQAPVRVAMSTIASAAGPGRVCARGGRGAGISWGHTVGVPPGLLPGLQAAQASKGSARGHARHGSFVGNARPRRRGAPRLPLLLLHRHRWPSWRSPTPHWFCANSIASASVRRPSASVLFTSTVCAARAEGEKGRALGGFSNPESRAACCCAAASCEFAASSALSTHTCRAHQGAPCSTPRVQRLRRTSAHVPALPRGSRPSPAHLPIGGHEDVAGAQAAAVDHVLARGNNEVDLAGGRDMLRSVGLGLRLPAQIAGNARRCVCRCKDCNDLQAPDPPLAWISAR